MNLSDEHALILWTATQAAQAAGVRRNTIDQWIRRGQLHRAAGPDGKPIHDSRNRMLFWATDVAHIAEARLRISRRAVDAPVLPDDVATATWDAAQVMTATGLGLQGLNRWLESGRLKSADPGAAEPRYRVLDVARAEQATRKKARRRYAAPAA